MVDRARRTRLAAIFLVAAAALAGCTSNGAAWQTPGGNTPTTPSKPPLHLVYSHESGEANVSPGKPVTVQASDGSLDTVSLASAAGDVPGLLAADGSMWRTVDDLAFGQAYTLTVKGHGADGKAVEETRTFTTVNPADGFYWNVSFKTSGAYYGVALNGGTFGVGQPIVAQFDDAVDRAVAQKTITVQTNPPVEGAWHWMSDREAHWRPQNYWAAGTTVTITANLFGVALTSPVGGRELHGQKNQTATFTIGPAKVGRIDNNTKQMVVSIDGQAVRTIPVSLGREQAYQGINGTWYDWRTPSGTMIVTEKQNPVQMKPDLPKNDPQYYEEIIPLATRITDSGIYVHAAPWSVNDQGVRNVSHGCVNVSTANAQWFFDTFGPGDVVEVANAGTTVGLRDGLGDWNMPWDQWVAGSAA
jgi:lipoprotein-anchoring transpeptidase ErfK/SrfK